MPNKQLTEKQKLISVIAFFVLWLSLSAFFWLLLHHWYYSIIPTAFIYLVQWVYDGYKFGQCYPPLVQPLCKYLKSKIRAKWYAKQRQKKQSEPISLPKLITLSEWLVTDMIEAKFGDYSSCYSKDHYEVLMCQYADSKADDDLVQYKELMKEKIAIQVLSIGIKFNIEILKDRWSNSAAEYIRSLTYPVLPWKLTPENKDDVLRFLTAFLIGQNLKLKDIDESIGKLFTSTGGSITTKEQYTQHIEDLLVEMAQVQAGAVYNLNGMTVAKLAAIERARNRHIKNLQDQIKRNKSGGKS